MRYTLLWPNVMITELARQYVIARSAGFGDAFTGAIHQVELRLANDPFGETESRTDDIRVLIESPVTV